MDWWKAHTHRINTHTPVYFCEQTSVVLTCIDLSSQAFRWHIGDRGNEEQTLAWKIPWTEESGRLQSMGSLRVRHD